MRKSKQIEQKKKAKYNLDRQTAKILALWSVNVGEYEFLMAEDVLLEKGLLVKAVTIKTFEYSLLSSKFKKANSQCKKKISRIRQGLCIW